MNLQPYINDIRELAPLNVEASFIPEHWQNYKYQNVTIVDDIYSIINDHPNVISRQDIITYLSRPDRTLQKGFLMTMIWGHGFGQNGRPDNRGPWKVDQMLADFKLSQIMLNAANNGLMVNDIISAHKAFDKMSRCGISFFSKFLYFLGRAIGMINYPLIFDARVAKTLAQLTSTNPQIFSILSFMPNQDALAYSIYVSEIHNIARQYSIEADKIEYFLFKGIIA